MIAFNSNDIMDGFHDINQHEREKVFGFHINRNSVLYENSYYAVREKFIQKIRIPFYKAHFTTDA